MSLVQHSFYPESTVEKARVRSERVPEPKSFLPELRMIQNVMVAG